MYDSYISATISVGKLRDAELPSIDIVKFQLSEFTNVQFALSKMERSHLMSILNSTKHKHKHPEWKHVRTSLTKILDKDHQLGEELKTHLQKRFLGALSGLAKGNPLSEIDAMKFVDLIEAVEEYDTKFDIHKFQRSKEILERFWQCVECYKTNCDLRPRIEAFLDQYTAVFKQTYEGIAPKTLQHVDGGYIATYMDAEGIDLLNHLRHTMGLSAIKPKEADQNNVLIGNRLYQRLKEWFPSGKHIPDEILRQISKCQAVSFTS